MVKINNLFIGDFFIFQVKSSSSFCLVFPFRLLALLAQCHKDHACQLLYMPRSSISCQRLLALLESLMKCGKEQSKNNYFISSARRLKQKYIFIHTYIRCHKSHQLGVLHFCRVFKPCAISKFTSIGKFPA